MTATLQSFGPTSRAAPNGCCTRYSSRRTYKEQLALRQRLLRGWSNSRSRPEVDARKMITLNYQALRQCIEIQYVRH